MISRYLKGKLWVYEKVIFMKRILIKFKDYQHSELRKLAYEENSNVSEQTRKAVDLYLKVKKEEKRDKNSGT